jgi:hypothetical protein
MEECMLQEMNIGEMQDVIGGFDVCGAVGKIPRVGKIAKPVCKAAEKVITAVGTAQTAKDIGSWAAKNAPSSNPEYIPKNNNAGLDAAINPNSIYNHSNRPYNVR